MKGLKAAWLVVGLLAASTLTLSFGGDAGRLEVSTERVIVFKDGYGMFVKEATGRTDPGGSAYIEGVPESMVLGSFWALPEKGELKSLTTRERIIPRQGRQESEKQIILQFDPRAADAEARVRLMHLQPGIRWIPTYRIALTDQQSARLVMQAEILNEAEDIAGAEVDLIVGVPNFRFREVVSPLSLVPELHNPLLRAAPQVMGHTAVNALFTQRAGETRGRRSAQPAPPVRAPAVPNELAAGGAQDLFVYNLGKLNLAAGERAAVHVVSTEIDFQHLYTWDVHLARSGAEALPEVGRHGSPLRLLKNEVWHQIELNNDSGVPWTTGAALVMQDDLPLGQELLTYTPVGGKVQLPLTVAVDVRGTYEEVEIGREPKALHWSGYDWVRIRKRGTLRLTNYKDEDISTIVTCQFGGNATDASDQGRISVDDHLGADWKDFRGHHALNGHSTIEWRIEVGAGETRELTCEYFYCTR